MLQFKISRNYPACQGKVCRIMKKKEILGGTVIDICVYPRAHGVILSAPRGLWHTLQPKDKRTSIIVEVKLWVRQDILINPHGSVFDGGGVDPAFVQAYRTGAANNGIGIAQVVHLFQPGNHESFADTEASCRLAHPHGADEATGRGIDADEPEDGRIFGGYKTAGGLVRHSNATLAHPTRAEMLCNPGLENMRFERVATSYLNALLYQCCAQRGTIRQLEEPYNHVCHSNVSKKKQAEALLLRLRPS